MGGATRAQVGQQTLSGARAEYSERAIPLADLFSPAELDRARARAEALPAGSSAETPSLRTEGMADEPAEPE